MKIPGFHIILLILVLVSFAIVPLACGEEQNNSVQAPINPCGVASAPAHCIPPEYFKDAKPATPLSESEMITIIISQQTYEQFSPKDKPGIVVIPVSYLDFSINFANSTSSPTWHYEKQLISGNSLAMIRMPYSLYDRFITTANGNNLELPASAYIRHYDNLADLHAHIEPDGMYLKETTYGGVDMGIQPSRTVPLIIVTTPRIIQTNSGTQPAPLPALIAIIAIGCVVMMAAQRRMRKNE